MLNPLYNLPCFLIGMFFGLVNFSIYRGANIKSDYSKIEMLDPSKKSYSDIDYKRRSSSEDSFSNSFANSYKNISSNINYIDNKRKLSFIKRGSESSESDPINTEERYSIFSSTESQVQTKNRIMKEMPFLNLPSILTNFHRTNQGKYKLRIIEIICLLLLVFFISIRYILIKIYDKKNDNEKIIENLSLKEIITNNLLNIIYIFDLELFVLIINWLFFYFYYKGGQINNFFSHNYWNIFIKSYFSYALVSGPVILYTFYENETILTVYIYSIILYSFINTIFVFLFTIIFYTFYEYPLRMLVKDFKRRKSDEIIEDDEDENGEKADYFSIKA